MTPAIVKRGLSYPATRARRVGPLVSRPEPEAVLLRKVTQLLELYGYAYYHTHDSRHSVAGFPDLIALKAQHGMAIELKSPRGTLTREQRAWLAAFAAVGFTCYVLRPADLTDFSIRMLDFSIRVRQQEVHQ